MAQRHEIGEPQRRETRPPAPPTGRKGGKIAVRKREHHEIGRILTEIDGCRGLFKPMALTKDDVHQISDPEPYFLSMIFSENRFPLFRIML